MINKLIKLGHQFYALCLKHLDKILHFLSGLLIMVFIAPFVHWAIPLGITFIFASIKEMWIDNSNPANTSDFWDWFWTIMGALIYKIPMWIAGIFI